MVCLKSSAVYTSSLSLVIFMDCSAETNSLLEALIEPPSPLPGSPTTMATPVWLPAAEPPVLSPSLQTHVEGSGFAAAQKRGQSLLVPEEQHTPVLSRTVLAPVQPTSGPRAPATPFMASQAATPTFLFGATHAASTPQVCGVPNSGTLH
jgi:hypothetical protein